MPAELTLSLGTLFGFLLVLARVGGALIFLPLPGLRQGPEPARALLALSLTMALFPLWPSPGVEALRPTRLVVWVVSEAALGIGLGMAVSFLIEALSVAAQIIGLPAGYSYAATVDPNTEADSNVLLVFANLMAGLLFFAMGLDRQVLRALAGSLATVPPGSYSVKPAAADMLIGLGGTMFSTGLRLALPVLVLLILVDVALALLGRVNQQLQLLLLAFPAKMLATLAFLAAISTLFLPVFRGAAERMLGSLGRLF